MRSFLYCLILLGLFACGQEESSEKLIDHSEIQEMTTLDSLSLAITKDPNNANNYYQRAMIFRAEGEFEQAIADIDRALVVDSAVADFHFLKGSIYYDDQRFKNAFEEFQVAVELDPEHEEALLKLSQIELILKQYDLAMEMVNKALRINPMNPVGYYLKGFIYLDGGDTATAVSSFQTSVEVDPQYYDGYIMLGKIWAEANIDYSLTYYDQAIAIQPQSVEALYNKAIVLQDNDRYSEAYPIYDQITEIDSTAYFAYYNRGYMMLVTDSTYQGAIKEFKRSIEFYPYYKEAFYNIGLCYENLEDYEQAETYYKRALEIDPQFDLAARGMSRILD